MKIFIFGAFVLIGVVAYTQMHPIKHIENVTIDKKAPLNLEYEKTKSLEYLNLLRQKSGMVSFVRNYTLETSAKNHANYLIRNSQIGHYEDKDKPLFTGVEPKDRMLYAGYRTPFCVENVSHNNIDYKDSVEGLFGAIYHRFGFLDFKIDEIGIGVAQNEKDPSKNAYVYDMGIYQLNDLCGRKSFSGYGKYVYKVCKNETLKIKQSSFDEAINSCRFLNNKVVIYPYDGQDHVPPAFFDEIPDPLPEYSVSGFPISIQFNEYYYKRVKLKSFKLYDKYDKEIDSVIYDHNSDINMLFKRGEYALFPKKRLEWGSEYYAVVEYINESKKYRKKWSFKTKELKNLHKIVNDTDTIFVNYNEENSIYYEPKNSNDILSDAKYSDGLEFKYIDKNTFSIKIVDKKSESYKVKIDNRVLTIKML